MVSGLSEADGKEIVKVRGAGNGSPFESVEELARRAGMERRALEALAAEIQSLPKSPTSRGIARPRA